MKEVQGEDWRDGYALTVAVTFTSTGFLHLEPDFDEKVQAEVADIIADFRAKVVAKVVPMIEARTFDTPAPEGQEDGS